MNNLPLVNEPLYGLLAKLEIEIVESNPKPRVVDVHERKPHLSHRHAGMPHISPAIEYRGYLATPHEWFVVHMEACKHLQEDREENDTQYPH